MELGESRASAGLARGVMKAADLCMYDTISCFVLFIPLALRSMILASGYRVGKETSTAMLLYVFTDMAYSEST